MRGKGIVSVKCHRNMMETAVDALPYGVAVIDASGDIAAVNRVWRKRVAAADAEWTDGGKGRSYRQLRDSMLLPESGAAEEVREVLPEVMHGGREAFQAEYSGQRDGENAWIGVEIHPLPAGQGEGVVLSARDITARKRREKELQGQKKKYELLAEHMEDVVFLQDRDRNLIYVSPSVEKTWGYTQEEILQMDIEDFMAPESYPKARKEFEEYMRKCEEEGQTDIPPRQYKYCRKNGDIRWGEFKPSFVQDEEGRVTGTVGVVRDITERKRAEQELERTNERLQETLEELRQTQREVIEQERERALTRMARGIAHNFKNALFTIHSMTYQLLNHPEKLEDTETTRHYLELIKQATDQASELTDRIRKFYHPGEEEAPAIIDLNELVQDAVSMTELAWQQEGRASQGEVRVIQGLSDVPPVEGCESELHEMLANLLLNAVDAMSNGGTITISTRVHETRVVLEVSDTGTGMSPETREKCFEPFYTTKGEEGSGLGLSTVRKIVYRHQGTVGVSSQEGEGSCFTVTFPAADFQTERAPEEQTSVGKLHVLLMEDDRRQRETVRQYLTEAGHTVDEVSNGTEGVENFDPRVHDLVIADQAMPGYTGREAAEAVQAEDSGVPVMLLTGFGSMMNGSERSSDPIDMVVSKPITAGELQEAIASMMGRETE